MSGHPFLMPTWINPPVQPPVRPLYPVPLAQAYPSLSQLINLQLQHVRSVAEEGKAHPSILRPRAVRLSDLNLLGTSGMSDWPRNMALSQGFSPVRFETERGELGWKPSMFQVSAPGQNCFDIRDSHCPDALLARYTDIGTSSHLPDFRDVSRLVHKPDVHLLFQDILYRQMELAHLRRMSELSRCCAQKEESIAPERGVNSMDSSWRVFPPSTISSEHALGDTEDSIRKIAMEKHVLDPSSARKDQSEVKAQDNDRRDKFYLQKLTQRALKNSQKHFMTPLPRQKDCRSGVLKSTAKLASGLKIVTCNESPSDEKVLERASSVTHSLTDFSNAKKTETNGTVYIDVRGIDLETDPRDKTGDNSDDRSMDLSNSVNTTLPSRHNLQGDRKIFKCPQCRYLTDRKNNLKRHVVTMHQESAKTLECCGIGFQSKAALRDHNAIFHRGGYRCHICSRNFCRKALLRRHLTVHSGQKDFFCDLCGYATSHKSNLERHQKVHNKRDVAVHVSKQRALSLKACGDLGMTLRSSYTDFLLHPEDFELAGHPDRSVFTYDNAQRSLTPTQNVRVRKQKKLSALMADGRGKSHYASAKMGHFNDLRTDRGLNDGEKQIPMAAKEVRSPALDISDQKMNASLSRDSHIQTMEDLHSMEFESDNSAKANDFKTDESNKEDPQDDNSNDALDDKIG